MDSVVAWLDRRGVGRRRLTVFDVALVALAAVLLGYPVVTDLQHNSRLRCAGETRGSRHARMVGLGVGLGVGVGVGRVSVGWLVMG